MKRMPTAEDTRSKLKAAFPNARFFVSRDRVGFGAWYWAFRIRACIH